jgi:hypothetical protein
VAANVRQEDEHEGCDYAPQGAAEDSIDVRERREQQRIEHWAVLEEQDFRGRSQRDSRGRMALDATAEDELWSPPSVARGCR